MNHQLSFRERLAYDPGQNGITVSAMLRLQGSEVSLHPRLDTGSSHCIFQRSYGERLGLNVESGYPLRIGTATGSFLTYGHAVTMLVKDFAFDLTAFFAEDYAFNRNVLGRHGFLNLVRLGLVDYDGALYLNLYHDDANADA